MLDIIMRAKTIKCLNLSGPTLAKFRQKGENKLRYCVFGLLERGYKRKLFFSSEMPLFRVLCNLTFALQLAICLLHDQGVNFLEGALADEQALDAKVLQGLQHLDIAHVGLIQHDVLPFALGTVFDA